MSFIGNLIGGLTGSNKAADAAQAASQTQANSALAGIDAYKEQLAALKLALEPYTKLGGQAVTSIGDLAGLNGNTAQGAATDAIANSSQFKTLLNQGTNAILQNASATGGLRGGNTENALMQYSPQLLNQLINERYGQLGGLVSLGQNSAAGVGNAGLQTGGGIAQLLQQQGSALAGGQIAAGKAAQNNMGNVLQLASAAAQYFSDRRLKTNIVRIGSTARGNARYRWDWRDGSGSAEGVIADEVEHIPGAVHLHSSGYQVVDYSKV